MLADIAGLDVDEWTAEGGAAAAKHDTEIVSGLIEAGTAAVQRVIISGWSGGKEVIKFTQYAYVTMETDPDATWTSTSNPPGGKNNPPDLHP